MSAPQNKRPAGTRCVEVGLGLGLGLNTPPLLVALAFLVAVWTWHKPPHTPPLPRRSTSHNSRNHVVAVAVVAVAALPVHDVEEPAMFIV